MLLDSDLPGHRAMGGKAPKTVIRGGIGIFYDRFSENNTLRARHNDGVSQLRYVVTNNQSNILGQAVFTANSVSNVPTASQLAGLAPLSSVPFRIASNLELALFSAIGPQY